MAVQMVLSLEHQTVGSLALSLAQLMAVNLASQMVTQKAPSWVHLTAVKMAPYLV